MQVLNRFNQAVVGEFNIAPDADLREANLSGANLIGADLIGANLSGADLIGAGLRGANLSGANLSRAYLIGANLSGANLSRADLRGADLIGANLSGVVGILRAGQWLEDNFEHDDHGYIAYKIIGHMHNPPDSWSIEPGSTLTETVNPDRGTDCGSGVNFATWEWCEKEGQGKPIWKARIPWRALPDVVVPFMTDGKARCGELELIDIFKGGEDD